MFCKLLFGKRISQKLSSNFSASILTWTQFSNVSAYRVERVKVQSLPLVASNNVYISGTLTWFKIAKWKECSLFKTCTQRAEVICCLRSCHSILKFLVSAEYCTGYDLTSHYFTWTFPLNKKKKQTYTKNCLKDVFLPKMCCTSGIN